MAKPAETLLGQGITVTCLLITVLLSAELSVVKSVLCGHPQGIANWPLNVG